MLYSVFEFSPPVLNVIKVLASLSSHSTPVATMLFHPILHIHLVPTPRLRTTLLDNSVPLTLWHQFVGKAISSFSMTMPPPCTKPAPWRNGFPSFRCGGKSFSGLCTAHCKLWAGPYHPASVLDFRNALVAEWEQSPAAWERINAHGHLNVWVTACIWPCSVENLEWFAQQKYSTMNLLSRNLINVLWIV